MGGFFGVISKSDCVEEVFYGTDYHSHLGTKRAGLVFIVPEKGFRRSIHNIEDSYFRNKFEPELRQFSGNSGLGVISDTDPQPILFNSHLGRFAIVTVSRMVNLAGRKAIQQLGGNEKELKEYADPDSKKHTEMVKQIAKNLNLDSLVYQRLDDLVEAIGLPKEKLCTHCWDGSSYF